MAYMFFSSSITVFEIIKLFLRCTILSSVNRWTEFDNISYWRSLFARLHILHFIRTSKGEFTNWKSRVSNRMRAELLRSVYVTSLYYTAAARSVNGALTWHVVHLFMKWIPQFSHLSCSKGWEPLEAGCTRLMFSHPNNASNCTSWFLSGDGPSSLPCAVWCCEGILFRFQQCSPLYMTSMFGRHSWSPWIVVLHSPVRGSNHVKS